METDTSVYDGPSIEKQGISKLTLLVKLRPQNGGSLATTYTCIPGYTRAADLNEGMFLMAC